MTDYHKMKCAGKAAAYVLDNIEPFIQENITTNELDIECNKLIQHTGGVSACLNYKNFPKHVCISVNHVVCHGIPSDLKLKKGDILNIDVTVKLDGHYGDTSRMFYIAPISKRAEILIQTTKEAMYKAIYAIKPGDSTCKIGEIIEDYCTIKGFQPVRDYGGHGIGTEFHMEPAISHYKCNDGVIIEEGMYFTIEPMINEGSYHVSLLNDGWTVVTKDRKLSAQFEHTIYINKNGAEIMTL